MTISDKHKTRIQEMINNLELARSALEEIEGSIVELDTQTGLNIKPVADIYELLTRFDKNTGFTIDSKLARQWIDGEPGNKVREYVEIERLKSAHNEISLNGWIKCSDALPDRRGDYICRVALGDCACRTYNTCIVLWSNNEWTDSDLCQAVTHWMPLPLPPSN